MAMGKDRLEFPSPPTDVAQFPDSEDLLELNEIITKACEPEPRRRYRSAKDMHSELTLLEGGGKPSVIRWRRKVRRVAIKLGSVATLIAAVLCGWMIQKRQSDTVFEDRFSGSELNSS